MIYFKIDYFDRAMSMHSPDPADPSVSQRVITSSPCVRSEPLTFRTLRRATKLSQRQQ
jgi:Protein of unknown function (DUF3768)